ncbi:hypothetical protein SPRG_13691 [Saprolegnia parasitica CBS 223.65]|uniref:CCDC81 HU domain-containing protein n=1 Tax=Saprolegnia parasitica (strain CBS 223.65) TaxID=695850 RepID=A0A067BSZ3_SAPPC|nr:hypothetical protein SPRG_13691 [Saprolegnia parasitica CBS 223.65]KDO21378.1 hypothetical protein SPRG_13691 [Saprolegnia parasitica CBS 223.65]|eukprot:XP_012207934.1 hypothetical protein SPRG_13691 [Saprolegnia parasitica CBS 223.65]
MYTLRNLLQDCSGKMTRTSCAADKKKETLEEVWIALNAWVEARYQEGKGAHIAPFGKISWETLTIGRNTRKVRPIFMLNDTFGKTYGLQYKKRVTVPIVAAIEDINFTKLAIKFSKNLTKDVVFCGVRDLLHKIGEVASTGAQMTIEMTIGKIVAKNRAIHLLFDPTQFPKALENIATASVASGCPSVIGDLADFDLTLEDCNQAEEAGDMLLLSPERPPQAASTTPRTPRTPHPPLSGREPVSPRHGFEQPTSMTQLRSPRPASRNGIGYMSAETPSRDCTTMLLSPPQVRQHSAYKEPSFDFSFKDAIKKELDRSGVEMPGRPISVADAAYERHMLRIEKEVEAEAQHAMDIHRHHMRDLDEIANEKRAKRRSAEKLQDDIRDQMFESMKNREIARRSEHGTDPAENTFISHSHHSRLGFNSPETHKRIQVDMHHCLHEQMNAKERARRDAREKALLEDKLFLEKLQRDIEQDREFTVAEQERQRKVLTQAWEKDHSIKVALQQSRKVMNDRIKGAIAPSALRHVQADDKPDFSVGFDVRASTK